MDQKTMLPDGITEADFEMLRHAVGDRDDTSAQVPWCEDPHRKGKAATCDRFQQQAAERPVCEHECAGLCHARWTAP